MRWTGAWEALSGRWGRVGLTVSAGYAGGLLYVGVLTPFAGAPAAGAAPLIALLSLLAVTGAWRAGRLRRLDARTRRAWQLFAAGLALMVASNILTDAVPHSSTFPSPGHYGRFAAALVMGVALHWFPLHTGDRPQRVKIGVDAAIMLATGVMIIWYFVISPYLFRATAAGTVLAGGVYPVIDLILLLAAIRLYLRGAQPATRRSARLVTAALLLLTLNDTVDSYHQAVDPGRGRGTTFAGLTILTVFALLALFPLEQRRLDGDRPAPARPRTTGISHLPIAAVVLSCALMSTATIVEQGLTRLSGLILAGTAVTLLVLLRQLITQQENHALATTDALTGLANRARIDESLARALETAERNNRHTTVLLADLNGFKTINDTLGHTAGDALLIQFAALLRRNVLGADLVGRLGGDEFLIILHGNHTTDHAHAVARRITHAMTEPLLIADTMIQPSASLGIATSAPGELPPDGLLHRADMAMYDHKRTRTDERRRAAESGLVAVRVAVDDRADAVRTGLDHGRR